MFYFIKLAGRYMKYLIRGKSKYFIHSPFVFDFINNVLNNKHEFYAYNRIDQQRFELLQSNEVINITDLGAGSFVNNTPIRPVKTIAKNAAKNKKFGKLLHRITWYYKPEVMAELGTSLGISALYQASGHTLGKLYTFEGCPETSALAQKNTKEFPLKNVEHIVGDFKDTFEKFVSETDKLDYVFFDGNHQKEPTLDYFNIALKKAHENSIFIFDDIHWSEEMEEAWYEIIAHPKVTVSIDLFSIGILFFKADQAKEDFTLLF